MLRRVVAALTWLVMVHLTMVGSDFICAAHSGDAAAPPHAMTHHEHASTSPHEARADQAPCRTPAIPMCCQALTSCAAALSLAESQHSNVIARAQRVVPTALGAMPLSQIIAPDPPPPRI